jgi:hypothetical protein
MTRKQRRRALIGSGLGLLAIFNSPTDITDRRLPESVCASAAW